MNVLCGAAAESVADEPTAADVGDEASVILTVIPGLDEKRRKELRVSFFAVRCW